MRIGLDARKIDDFGIGSYIHGLAAALIATQPEEKFILFGRRAALTGLAEKPNVEVVAFDAGLYSLRELVIPRRLATRHRLDLFHEPHYTLPFVPVPSVVTVHDLIHLRLRGIGSLHRRVYARRMAMSALARAHAVICVSRAVADEVAELLPTVASKTEVVANGVDSFFFEEPELRSIERDLSPFSVAAKSYFLFVGNDKPHKNLDRVVAAFTARRAAGSDAKLVIAGGAPERFRHVDGVVIAGRIERGVLRSLYRGALALLFVSLEEGFGLPAAEAMVSGIPAIVSDTAVMREVAGEAALRVDPLRVEAMVEAMRRLEGDAPLRMELAQRGREAGRRFDWKVAAERTMEIYRRAAAGAK